MKSVHLALKIPNFASIKITVFQRKNDSFSIFNVYEFSTKWIFDRMFAPKDIRCFVLIFNKKDTALRHIHYVSALF